MAVFEAATSVAICWAMAESDQQGLWFTDMTRKAGEATQMVNGSRTLAGNAQPLGPTFQPTDCFLRVFSWSHLQGQ